VYVSPVDATVLILKEESHIVAFNLYI